LIHNDKVWILGIEPFQRLAQVGGERIPEHRKARGILGLLDLWLGRGSWRWRSPPFTLRFLGSPWLAPLLLLGWWGLRRGLFLAKQHIEQGPPLLLLRQVDTLLRLGKGRRHVHEDEQADQQCNNPTLHFSLTVLAGLF
jgi:hypothetical protein